MDALIKSLRPGKPSDIKPSDIKGSDAKPSEAKAPEARPAELDPAEFLAAAVRADQPRPSRAEAEAAVETLLGYIGENPEREGLVDTPRRVVEAFDELYQGYHQCPAEALNRTEIEFPPELLAQRGDSEVVRLIATETTRSFWPPIVTL